MTFKAFDIETTGFSPYTDKIFSYCIGDWEGEVDVYRLDIEESNLNWRNLDRFFKDISIAKVCHNFHFELGFMKSHNIYIPDETGVPLLSDTKCLIQISPSSFNSLKWIATA